MMADRELDMDERYFAQLDFAGVRLLLPQDNAAAIEVSADIDTSTGVAGALGMLRANGLEWPAFALDAACEPCTECPPNYRFCIAINLGDLPAFALACEKVDRLELADGRELRPLEPCMRQPLGPVESLLLRDGRLLLLADVARLRRYLLPEIAA